MKGDMAAKLHIMRVANVNILRRQMTQRNRDGRDDNQGGNEGEKLDPTCPVPRGTIYYLLPVHHTR